MNYPLKNLVRHGDLLLEPAEMPEGNHTLVANGVLARGESTGHSHRLVVLEDAEVFDAGYNGMFVRVGERGVSLTHEEHKPVQLQPNTTYKVTRAREHDYLSDLARQVRD